MTANVSYATFAPYCAYGIMCSDVGAMLDAVIVSTEQCVRTTALNSPFVVSSHPSKLS